jgi:hypothetical protein
MCRCLIQLLKQIGGMGFVTIPVLNIGGIKKELSRQ